MRSPDAGTAPAARQLAAGAAARCGSSCWRLLRLASAASAFGAGAASPPAAAAVTSSPSAARMAISALTLTPSVPAGTTSLATVPSSTASTSIVALSVSISAMHIAGLDRVAFLDQPLGEVALFHGRRQGGHRDIDRHVLSPPLFVADGFDGLDDFADIRQRQLFKIGRVRHRHVLAGNRQDRRIEIIEGLLHDAGGDFGADRVTADSLPRR